MSLPNLQKQARDHFLTGVRAADPAIAVRKALSAQPIAGTSKGTLFLVAFGKAACPMMEEALRHVSGGQACKAIAVPNYENAREIAGCTVLAAGHPLPDENGLAAGKAVMRLLASATAEDLILCLISGGGSALLPTPRGGLTLQEKIAVNDVLLGGGLDIHQMNQVRQQLSVLKGGGLLDIAAPAPVRSLIISDVIGDDLSIIASGPTAGLSAQSAPVAILKEHGLWRDLPAAAQRLLECPRAPTRRVADNQLICSNQLSLEAIVNAAVDFNPRIVKEPLQGDVEDAADRVFSLISALPETGPQMIVWGGETTVKLKGKGRGGRNQELSLRVAKLASDLPGDWVFLSGGTDGRDGPTDATGGLVSRASMTLAEKQAIDVDAALAINDSYRVLQAIDGLLVTGGTGTNVADIQLFMRSG